jgi:hypothetical protein
VSGHPKTCAICGVALTTTDGEAIVAIVIRSGDVWTCEAHDQETRPSNWSAATQTTEGRRCR